MARYAQGYERKSSDTKNLFILLGSIVGVVVLSIVAVILINAFKDFSEKTYQSEEYAEFFVTADKLLKPEQDVTEYYVYVCEAEATSDSDSNMSYVLAYLDKYIAASDAEKANMVKIYLFNYCSVEDSESDIAAVEQKLNAVDDLAATQLYKVKLEEVQGYGIINTANKTSDRFIGDDATDKLKSLVK